MRIAQKFAHSFEAARRVGRRQLSGRQSARLGELGLDLVAHRGLAVLLLVEGFVKLLYSSLTL